MRRIKAALAGFFHMLDTEAVELYQWLFYLIIAADGAQNLFIAHGQPLTMLGSMSSHPFFEYWCVLEIVAPLCCLVGRVMHRNPLYKRQADTFQMYGDAILGSSEVCYVIATFHIEPVGKGGHGGYLGLAFATSAYLLAIRAYRRRRVEKRQAEECGDEGR